MESDISELIETAAPTNNEEEEEDIIPVESGDEKERFEDEFGEDEAVTIRFRMKYKCNKNRLPTREKDVVKAIDISEQRPLC